MSSLHDTFSLASAAVSSGTVNCSYGSHVINLLLVESEISISNKAYITLQMAITMFVLNCSISRFKCKHMLM